MGRDRWPPRIIAVNGPGGVGKTSLIRHFLATNRLSETPVWIDLYADARAAGQIDSFVERMLSGRETRDRDLLVVLDGAEQLDDKQIETAVGRIFNWKAVRGLVISSRRKIPLKRFSHYSSETLDLGPLDLEAATAVLKSASNFSLDPADLTRLANAVNGYPLALQLIASLVRTNDPGEIARLLAGNFYDLSDLVSAPSSEIIDIAKPVIISASEALVRNLQKRPEDLLRISPRNFEMVLAELLTDMGWEVELTKATRDGGKDILAYMNTSIGRLLCLVEAKKYRKDRKIGVDLVRTLYGTLCDYQANSAMMVTTSTFSPDAHEFQQRHQYQLSLRDYSDVVTWITKFKSNVRG
jgi:restriction system protein